MDQEKSSESMKRSSRKAISDTESMKTKKNL